MMSTAPLQKSAGKEAKRDTQGETFDEKFKTNLAVLKEYRRLHGSCHDVLFCRPQMIDNYVHSNPHHIDTGHACPAQKESKLGRWLSDMRERYRNQVSSSAYTCTFFLFRSVLFGIHVYHKALISSMCMHAWNGNRSLRRVKLRLSRPLGSCSMALRLANFVLQSR